jgi:hypothetical protein
MKTNRRRFLQATAATATAGVLPAEMHAIPQGADLDGFLIAKRHALVRDLPTPVFFEGMLLGNGDIGVCAVVRPDAFGLYIGKSDSWDIRVSEDFEKDILTFQEILKLWGRAGEEAKRLGKPDMLYLETRIDFFQEYTRKVRSSYARPWPRPWPCGTVWIHWDPRWVAPGRQTLDPATGLYTLDLTCTSLAGRSHPVKVSCFVDWVTGLVSVSTDGPVLFSSVDYYPDLDSSRPSPTSEFGPETSPANGSLLPRPEIDGKAGDAFAEFSCFQYFPAIGPTAEMPNPPHSDKDRNFALHGRIAGAWELEGLAESQARLKQGGGTAGNLRGAGGPPRVSLRSHSEQPLRLGVKVVTPRDILLERLEREAGNQHPWIIIPQDHAYSQEELDTPSYARKEVERLAGMDIVRIREDSQAHWREFWSRSAVELDDKELERIWYQNQYWLACCLRERKVAPGIFGNWSTGRIGTAWHGDYHMDYNTQQVFWGVFASNHVDQHLPYVEVCQNLMAMSEKCAKDKFDLPGAYFPHSAYPVPSQMVPYPVPPWALQISETPWTVQSLWWQYLYTGDVDYLRHVYPILLAAVRFIAAYVKKGDDGKYHVIPTVSSENWGFTVDYRLNKDCILDLALIQFLLDAMIEASSVLGQDQEERARWKEIREGLAPYPKAQGPYGEVWLDVVDAPVEHVYNVPLTLSPVFPAEQVGLGRGEDQLDIARRTARVVRLEGGNDLVYQPLIRARLGVLDLAWFKGEVGYCSLPDGITSDRVRQVGGRYSDSLSFDFMLPMGVWTENFALPAVLNECMMQSYTGTLRLFPNTQGLGRARFRDLRAAGAFLLSAACDGKTVSSVTLFSEKGATAKLENPWPGKQVRVTPVGRQQPLTVSVKGSVVQFPTQPGVQYRIEPA